MRRWLASAGFVGLYATLALFVRRSPDNSLDRRVLDWVLAWDAAFLDRSAEWISWITDTEPRVVMAIIGLVGVAATGRFRFVAAVLLTTAVTAIPTDALDDIGGVFTGRERPNGAPFKAYPSGHTLGTITQFGFSIFLAIRLGIRRWLLAVVVVIFGVPMLLVGPARLVRGVHWPTDVIGAYLLGAGSLIATVLVFELADRWLSESGWLGSWRSKTGSGIAAEDATAARGHQETGRDVDRTRFVKAGLPFGWSCRCRMPRNLRSISGRSALVTQVPPTGLAEPFPASPPA